jgi:hypothetical protein
MPPVPADRTPSPRSSAPPPPTVILGLYGKGAYDVTKARADLKKALEDAEKNFSKTKPYNCTIQPEPRPQRSPAHTSGRSSGLGAAAQVGQKFFTDAGSRKRDRSNLTDEHASASDRGQPPSTND